jgi:hypothetical protein
VLLSRAAFDRLYRIYRPAGVFGGRRRWRSDLRIVVIEFRLPAFIEKRLAFSLNFWHQNFASRTVSVPWQDTSRRQT